MLDIPGLVLFSTSIGFGALAKDLGFSIGHTIFLSAVLYATPAQIVLVDQLARGAALTAAALAVSLTAIRLLPMVVTMMPYIRDERSPRWLQLLAVHFVAITAWVEGQRRLPLLPQPLRLSHFLGIGSGLASCAVGGSVAGFELAGLLPALLSATLLFMTPLYFLLSMMTTARLRADYVAIISGCILGPAIYLVAPGLDLLATGLIGGTAAYLAGRVR
jgi:predicted branched-subunit amino acid permease